MTEQIQKIDTQNREIEEVFQELDTIAEKLEEVVTHRWRILFVYTKKVWSF